MLVSEGERAGSDFDDDDFGGGGEDNFCLGDGDAPTPVEPMGMTLILHYSSRFRIQKHFYG